VPSDRDVQATLHPLGRTGTFGCLNLDAVIREGLDLEGSLRQGP
jgi:hypothetical protein